MKKQTPFCSEAKAALTACVLSLIRRDLHPADGVKGKNLSAVIQRDFVLFIVLNKLLRKCNIKGITTCSYLVGYGLIRFVLEFFRASEQTLYVGSFPVSQLVSIICVLLGVAGIVTLLLVNNRKNSSIETV